MGTAKTKIVIHLRKQAGPTSGLFNPLSLAQGNCQDLAIWYEHVSIFWFKLMSIQHESSTQEYDTQLTDEQEVDPGTENVPEGHCKNPDSDSLEKTSKTSEWLI